MERQIQEMEEILRRGGGESVERFEHVLAQVASRNDPGCISLLLPLFDDEAEYDEVNFSLLHLIESFDDSVYVDAIVTGLAGLLASAPRWARIIHMRILNSPSSLIAYKGRLQTCSRGEGAVVRSVLKRLIERNPQFEERCLELLALVD